MHHSPTSALFVLALACAMFRTSAGQEAFQPPALGGGVVPELFDDYFFTEDGGIQLAQMLQPPGGQPIPGAQQPAPRRYATGGRQSGNRLASVPNMFGDLALTTTTVLQFIDVQFGTQSIEGTAEIPLAGGSRTGKLAENDLALPMDRVFFSYNHFHNVFEVAQEPLGPPGFPQPPVVRQQSIDRYTIGAEKTFLGGWYSIEIRMPFNGTFDTNLPTSGISGGNVGNLAVLVKSLLFQNDNTGIGVGLAIETPTASDVDSRIGPVNIHFLNEAVHLLPFIGFLWAPGDPSWGWSDGLFLSGFAQIDIATNGNTVQFVGPGGVALGDLGKFNEQNLLFLDLAMGYWLYRDSDAPRLTGLAVVGEVHYVTTVQDSDFLVGAGAIPGFPGGFAGTAIGSPDNRFDVVNGTIGIQALLFDASSLRVAGVFPLGTGEDERFFDSEVQVQFNRRF